MFLQLGFLERWQFLYRDTEFDYFFGVERHFRVKVFSYFVLCGCGNHTSHIILRVAGKGSQTAEIIRFYNF